MDGILKPVWIEPSWLFWEGGGFAQTELPRDAARRPYELHQHACDLLAGSATELSRVDAITTLRRAVGQRVRVLKEAYQLRALPIRSKPKDDLELMSYFGIIRPLMLRRLIEIRNIVEHRDSTPPPTGDCLMFADFVWYFLRSTDQLAYTQAIMLSFDSPGVEISKKSFRPSVELTFYESDNVLPNIRAWLKSGDLAYEAKVNWIQIYSRRIEYSSNGFDVLIDGEVRGNDEQMRIIWTHYFVRPF